jgi:hypothetical protein
VILLEHMILTDRRLPAYFEVEFIQNQWKSYIQSDQKVSVLLIFSLRCDKKNSVYSNNPNTIYNLKMAIREYIRNVDRAILNTVFGNSSVSE